MHPRVADDGLDTRIAADLERALRDREEVRPFDFAAGSRSDKSALRLNTWYRSRVCRGIDGNEGGSECVQRC
jgi:hypothetical protein